MLQNALFLQKGTILRLLSSEFFVADLLNFLPSDLATLLSGGSAVEAGALLTHCPSAPRIGAAKLRSFLRSLMSQCGLLV